MILLDKRYGERQVRRIETGGLMSPLVRKKRDLRPHLFLQSIPIRNVLYGLAGPIVTNPITESGLLKLHAKTGKILFPLFRGNDGISMGFSRIVLTLLFGCWLASVASASEAVWYDLARHRSIPVRIYFPRSAEKAPVILFSHGIGSSIDHCAYLAKAWAAHGFVCVLVQHPGSDENIKKGKIRILNEYKSAYEQNWSSRTRAKDLHFVLDCLEEIVQSSPPFAARLDMDRIGVGGIDLGALAALLLAGQVPPDYGSSLYDPRVKAVLALSPPVRSMNIGFRKMYQPITVPTLFITGTKDDSIVGSTMAAHRRIPFDSMDHCQRYLITLEGGDHRIYGDRVVSFVGGRDDEKFQSAIVRSSSCFWRAVLLEEPRAVRAMDNYGWASLTGVRASIERRSANSVLLGGGISADSTQPSLDAE